MATVFIRFSAVFLIAFIRKIYYNYLSDGGIHAEKYRFTSQSDTE